MDQLPPVLALTGDRTCSPGVCPDPWASLKASFVWAEDSGQSGTGSSCEDQPTSLSNASGCPRATGTAVCPPTSCADRARAGRGADRWLDTLTGLAFPAARRLGRAGGRSPLPFLSTLMLPGPCRWGWG